ncbi:STAS domain-containing protein [Falsibacillus albus]|uniref:STAS domain-containing protein n=1 Tax=Falsibacillus albus TaxID=2478915 RepID=A0A3L7JR82_9BACI|nr:STAS domain-containing protein [Falsibacillus albus]RLQ93347.1 STAS domain-containing protein [Falsibacillus albus]
MNQKNKALCEYILAQSNELTKEWLNSREESPSIYSKNAAPHHEKRLMEQNGIFIKFVAENFVSSNEENLQEIKKWAKNVAEDRASTYTPIQETVHQFKKFRNILMAALEDFIQSVELEISMDEMLSWNRHLQNTVDFVLELYSEKYYQVTSSRMTAQQEMIYELSSPIIPISDYIGVLPIIGDIDTERAKRILENTLAQCVEKNLSQLFIDLSGVPIIDTMVAHQIFQVMSTLKLVGVESILSGIRPEVAQTAVQLGINFKDVSTHSSLKQALHDHDFRVKKVN